METPDYTAHQQSRYFRKLFGYGIQLAPMAHVHHAIPLFTELSPALSTKVPTIFPHAAQTFRKFLL